jgi:hypothetical protein
MSTGGADKPGGGGGGAVKTPSDFLKSIRGRPVVVKLNSGVDYRGINHAFFSRFRYSAQTLEGGRKSLNSEFRRWQWADT